VNKVVVSVLALALILSGQSAGAQVSLQGGDSEHHKVQVTSSVLAERIKSQGGQLIADYGSYQLYDVPRLNPDFTSGGRAEVHDEYNKVMLNSRHLDTTQPETRALRKPVGSFTGKRMHLVQFTGPVQPEWRDTLAATGIRIVSYIPQNTYLVYGDSASIARLQGLGSNDVHIQWEAAYQDDDKIHPLLKTKGKDAKSGGIGTSLVEVQLAVDEDANTGTFQLLDEVKLEPVKHQDRVLDYVNLIVRVPPESLSRIAARPDVVSIQPHFEPRPFCERQDQIVAGNLSGNSPSGAGYLGWLADRGFTQAQFTASGFVVDVSDSGIDDGTTSPHHFGLYVSGSTNNSSRVVYSRLVGTANTGSTLKGCDGHGTLNSHIIGGYDDSSSFPFADDSGYHYGLGVCPFVELGSSVIFDPTNYTYPNFTNIQSQAYAGGARICNNSWGATSAGAYTAQSQAYDVLVRDAQPSVSGNQEMVIVFSAGNSGSSTETVGSPGTAKNVITVGAGENVQAFGGSDGSGITDAQANSANDMTSFSSRGPCTDGRHKPDLSAPGTHVSGGVAQSASPGSYGSSDSCFTGSGVSGGLATSSSYPFFPAGQEFYTASSGTSHSAPAVAGGCALLRQYFINNFTAPASPAMTKGYLMNSARYMTGSYAGDTLWSDVQGMGEMNLGMAFDGVPRLLRDEVAADLFTASGQSRVFTGTIADTNEPFRVTLVWSDAPGSTTGNAYNNNLDLSVTVGGNMYKGNVFSGAYSTTGGSADTENNVESVFLPAGVSGSFVVTIVATSINSIGVPNSSNTVCQDFALVAYNANAVSMPVLTSTGATLTAESFTPTNGAIDPNETVILGFGFENVGAAATTNLVVTLLSGSNVISPSAAQTIGALATGGTAAAASFSFMAIGTCGGTITATLQFQDGGVNLGTLDYTLQLGNYVTVTNLSQSFDGVTAPALPSGWSNSISGSVSNWITYAKAYYSSPNSAFVGEATNAGISELTSPVIAITSTSAQLTFINDYMLEAPGFSASMTYDGGVLEIRIGSGSFTNILAAGGSFSSGGYTRTISSSTNPLNGRSAWGGNSGGFISTIVNLPASAAAQNIQLKWRLGTDVGNDYGGSGWCIDNVLVKESYYSCASNLVAPAIVDTRIEDGNVTFSFQTASGQSYTVQYQDALANGTWNTLQSFAGDGSVKSITNTLSSPQRFYRVKSP
jgi:hypothetical protein